MLPQPYTVLRNLRETHDTFTLDLKPAAPSGRFPFAVGQFNMLYVFGVGEVPISISGDPARTEVLTHTIREAGTVTRVMRGLRQGDAVGVRGPYGQAWPVAAARGQDVVLIAGGIGLAPLRPVLYQIQAEREKYGKVVLLYGTRSPEDILYRKELEHWRARLDLEVNVTVDHGFNWRGNVGVVTRLIPRAGFDPYHAVALVCGPEMMMRYTVLELQKRGLKDEDIYLSMERNMKCGIGLCGHCQYGWSFVCKNGPVYRFDALKDLFWRREV